MKREELEKLGLSKEQIDQIMAINGQDIEKQKQATTAAETERDGLKTQLTEANATIDGFKNQNIDQIKASVDEWKTKAEKAQVDGAAQIAQLKFDHALDGALTGAKAKNAVAVKALLKVSELKLSEDGQSIIGLDDQLKKVKEANDYLFESEGENPQIVTGGKTNGTSTLTMDQIRKMSTAEINKNWDAVQATLSQQK